MGIRVLIVDDEALGRQALHSLLARDPQVTQILEAATGREAIGFLETRSADVVFLDIQLPDMDGVSVVSEFESHELPAIIFVTAHEQYAVQAFNLSAVDYLLKPVGATRFSRAFEKAKTLLRTQERSPFEESAITPSPFPSGTQQPLRQIAVRLRQKIVLVPTQDIDWIRAADDYVELHAAGSSYLLHATLNKLAAKLDPRTFLRVHRSIIVNLNAIKEITPGLHGDYEITLQDGSDVRSGRTYSDAMRQLLSNSL
jgi:two-component system, LytTR family, response regulator